MRGSRRVAPRRAFSGTEPAGELVPPPGRGPARRPACARWRGRPDGTVEGIEDARRAASCSACSGTPRRSTGPASRTRGCSRRWSPPPRGERLDLARANVRLGVQVGASTVKALGVWAASLAPRGPDGYGAVGGRRRRMVHRAARGHRPERAGAQPMVDAEQTIVFKAAASTTTASCGRAAGARDSLPLAQRHRGAAQGLARVGRGPAALLHGMFAFACATVRGTRPRAATGWASASRWPGGRALPGRVDACPALLAGGGVDTAWTRWRCTTTTVAGARSCPRRGRSCAE